MNAAGYDDIPSNLLKLTSDSISGPLIHIIDICFRFGEYPDRLKIAKAIPIHKTGSKENINNYWLISLLPFISKTLKRHFLTGSLHFLKNNSLLSSW